MHSVGPLGDVLRTFLRRPESISQGRTLDVRLGRPLDVILRCPQDVRLGRLGDIRSGRPWDNQIGSLGDVGGGRPRDILEINICWLGLMVITQLEKQKF